MRSIAAFSVIAFSFLAGAGAAAAGTVTSVKASVASADVGVTITVTASGTNPCGAAHINYGDGTAITYAITGLPTSQTHAYDKPGPYTITARGMGNCDGEATTRIDVTGQAAPPPPPPAAPNEIASLGFTPRPGIVRQPVAINVGPFPQRVNHAYAVADTYTVIAAPVAPCVGKFTERLQIVARGGERITGLTIDPEPADVRRNVTIVVEGVGTCAYRIDYGDGNHEDRTRPLPDRLSHVYNAPDSYIISVVASGTCQGRAQRALDVR